MKRFIRILLSLIMLLSLIPTAVFASDYIREVRVTNISMPIAGEKWDSQWDKASMVYKDSPYSVFQKAEWYDETEKRFMTPNETFEVGHVYTVQVWVEANDGYEFDASVTDYNMKGYINEKEAKLSKAFEYQRWAMVVLSYTFPEVKNNKKITNISVTDIVEPKIGRQSIARPHYLKYSEGVKGYQARWYEDYDTDAEGNEFNGIFAAEKTYTLEVIMEAEDGYEFTRKNPVVTFNGYMVNTSVHIDGVGRLVARHRYDNLGTAKEKVMGVITYNIKEPVIGEKPSYVAENQRDDNLYVIDTQYKGKVNGIEWEEGVGGNSRVMSPDDTFKAGEYYHVTIRVKPVDGYLFDTDRNDDFMMVGAINGKDAICSGTDESAFVGLTFDKLEAPETRKVISEVEIISNHPDICYVGGQNYTPHFEVIKGAPATVSFNHWRQTNSDGIAIDCDATDNLNFFEFPTELKVCISIRGEAGKEYVLSKDVSVTINGQKCHTAMFKSGEDYSDIYASTPEFMPVSKENAPTFTVSFDSMGGSRVNSINNLYYGEGIEEPAKPVRDGYTFKRWYEDKECEVAFIFKDATNSNGGYARIYEDITLYAKWEKSSGEKDEDSSKSEAPSVSDKPQETEKSTFVDVAKGQYYYEPVMWAVAEGITSGTGANTFSPDSICSRAQVVTFLHRMVASPEPAAIDNPFTDVRSDYYYYKPVMWAYGSKITGGTSANKFSPDSNCTRAQVVTFLWRTAGQPKAKGGNNPFKDVKADSYYYDAVLWAVENGITGGTSANTFSPDSNCTRAQVVTFMYRLINE